MSNSLLPLVDLDSPALAGLRRPAPNLYRALAHSPELLAAWTGLAWPLRDLTDVPRGDRELAITYLGLRRDCTYVATHHRRFARRHGITDDALAGLGPGWRESDVYTSAQRATLTAVDDVVASGVVSKPVVRELEDRCGRRGMLLVIVTLAFYEAVCVVNRSLRIPLERGAS